MAMGSAEYVNTWIRDKVVMAPAMLPSSMNQTLRSRSGHSADMAVRTSCITRQKSIDPRGHPCCVPDFDDSHSPKSRSLDPWNLT
jgi:hypothetical protein